MTKAAAIRLLRILILMVDLLGRCDESWRHRRILIDHRRMGQGSMGIYKKKAERTELSNYCYLSLNRAEPDPCRQIDTFCLSPSVESSFNPQ